jgi:hypothetical protein
MIVAILNSLWMGSTKNQTYILQNRIWIELYCKHRDVQHIHVGWEMPHNSIVDTVVVITHGDEEHVVMPRSRVKVDEQSMMM